LLSTTLTIAEASYTIPNSNIRVNSRLLNGEFPGPTFRIKPGDTLQVTYNNDLADQGIGYVHNTYSGNDESNVHFHGLHVSGELPSDDTTYVSMRFLSCSPQR
jgi:FtsP/CotA-like multicopper oxidase with cupredoxin domain